MGNAVQESPQSRGNDGGDGTGEGASLARYHRQMLLPGVGEAGQRRLLRSRALVVGCGALGTVIADLLVRAGVGGVTIVDRDTVELTNLQRQTLFDEADAAAGVPKAEAAARKLARVNSGVRVRGLVEDFNHRTAERIAFEEDGEDEGELGVVLDATDNFQTRYLINDLCVKHGVPFVYGGAVGTVGMSMTVAPRGMRGVASGEETACLRCVFPDVPAPGTTETCDTAGVLGSVTAMVGAYEVAEAMKLLLGRVDLISRSLERVDLWGLQRQRIEVGPAREDCPCCGGREFVFLDGSMAARATVLCGRGSVQVNPPLEAIRGRLDMEGLARRLAAHGAFESNRLMVRGTLREGGMELTVFPDARAIVKGTTDAGVAMAVYARYVGV